jgi:hypothetical protein
MVKNKKEPSPNLSMRANLIKKIRRFFDWIAEGQRADALCKG